MSTTADERQLLQLYDNLPPDVRSLAIEALRRLDSRDQISGPFGWLLGYHYTSIKPGEVECAIEVTRSHLNPGGVAHGGVLYSVADAAMGAAVMSLVEPGQRCVTAELKVNYLQAVAAGRVVARAKVVRKGGRLATVTAEVRDADDEVVGLALGTFVILTRRSTPQSGK